MTLSALIRKRESGSLATAISAISATQHTAVARIATVAVANPTNEESIEALIAASATFWEWDADDLRLIRETAATDPEGIRLALATDPLRPFVGTVEDTELHLTMKGPTHDS